MNRKNIVKLLLVTYLLMSAQATQAGFVTGAIVGATLANSSSTSTSSSNPTISSVTYDVIACRVIHGKASLSLCKIETGSSEFNPTEQCYCVTPQEFATRSGYPNLHKVGTQFVEGNMYLILEVYK
jgi:hypothetical protein